MPDHGLLLTHFLSPGAAGIRMLISQKPHFFKWAILTLDPEMRPFFPTLGKYLAQKGEQLKQGASSASLPGVPGGRAGACPAPGARVWGLLVDSALLSQMETGTWTTCSRAVRITAAREAPSTWRGPGQSRYITSLTSMGSRLEQQARRSGKII